MNLSLSWILGLVPFLLLLEGFFSGSEIALLSADKLRLKTESLKGSRGAKLALELVTHPERILSSTLLITSLFVIGTSSLITLYLISRSINYSSVLAVLITSPLIVLFGELLPKTLYQRNADKMAPWVARPVYWVFWTFFPITRVMSTYTSKLSQILGPIEEILTGKKRSTREDLRSMLSYSRRETELKLTERRMIKRIFDFKDAEAKHALIPLVRVEAIKETATAQEALERFKSHRHSRMPVYSERIDNIVGVLEIGDLAAMTGPEQPIAQYLSPAHYVAETQPLKDLLHEMRREDNELVVIVDEYGGAVGILTFEDIVEEIVGEIHDEDDTDVTSYRELSENKWLVQARTEIQELNESLRLHLAEGDYETLGGFLLQQFGRIPELGDELYFDAARGLQLKFTVRKATERRIELVLIEKINTG